MSKDEHGWKTDRKDLVEALRSMSARQARKLLNKYKDTDSIIKNVRALGHAPALNLLMTCLLSGSIPESEVL